MDPREAACLETLREITRARGFVEETPPALIERMNSVEGRPLVPLERLAVFTGQIYDPEHRWSRRKQEQLQLQQKQDRLMQELIVRYKCRPVSVSLAGDRIGRTRSHDTLGKESVDQIVKM